jgi:uroporphyrinogen III methyltransferase / synthase
MSKQPLAGKRIVVTRAKAQAGLLSERLLELGAEVIELPTIEIQPASDYGPLDSAIARLNIYDWLIFTSANGVLWFVERLRKVGREPRSIGARICAIGPATKAEVEALGLTVELMGEEYVAEGLLAAFEPYDILGKRILLPRAAVARDVVPDQLRTRGATVEVVEAYRTGVPAESVQRARQIFGAGRKPDITTFTSSSTVQHFVDLAGAAALNGVKVASIGPITSQTARELGIEVAVEAEVYTIDGLVRAIVRLCETQVTSPSVHAQ